MRDANIQRADPDEVVELRPVELSAAKRKRYEISAAIGVSFFALVFSGVTFTVIGMALAGQKFNGRVIRSPSQVEPFEWAVTAVFVGVSLWLSWLAVRRMMRLPGRFREIESGMYRRWLVEFPASAGENAWAIEGFGEDGGERRLDVKLLRAKPDIGGGKSFRFSGGPPEPNARIYAGRKRVGRAGADSDSSWVNQSASHTEHAGRPLKVVTQISRADQAKPDGHWRVRIDLVGGQVMPETLIVSQRAGAHAL